MDVAVDRGLDGGEHVLGEAVQRSAGGPQLRRSRRQPGDVGRGRLEDVVVVVHQVPSPGRTNGISGTMQTGDMSMQALTAMAMSSGWIMSSAATSPLTKSVIGVST